MSAGKDQEYFSDGLAEELTNDLAKVPGLKVAGRSSAFQFKGRNEDPRTVGRTLNVANILEGSVRREGSRVRITAEVTKAADGFQLWSEEYNTELKDIFAVQDEIARAVTGALQVKLLGTAAAPVAALSATGTTPGLAVTACGGGGTFGPPTPRPLPVSSAAAATKAATIASTPTPTIRCVDGRHSVGRMTLLTCLRLFCRNPRVRTCCGRPVVLVFAGLGLTIDVK